MHNNLNTICDNGALLIVAPIPPLEELEREADKRDLQSVEAFTSPSRRAERLAWRRVLRDVAPAAEVEYAPSGAPRLKNSPYTYISVSHCRDVVAVVLSNARCGVDVERVDRDFSRVAERYMTAAERDLCAAEWWAAAVWCAKECLYKMAEREGVNFREDMVVLGVDTADRRLLCRGVDGAEIALDYRIIDQQHIVVYKL